MKKFKYVVKYILVGNSGVGKSSIMEQFVFGKIVEIHDTTIGIDFGSYVHNIDDNNCMKLQIWDTAGQEKYKCIMKSYYRGAICVFFIFDLTDQHSFDDVACWLSEIKKYCDNNVKTYLIGNKSDLPTIINKNQILAFAEINNMKYYEISAKDNISVKTLFMDSINDVYIDICSGVLKVDTQKCSIVTFRSDENKYYPQYGQKSNACRFC